MEPRLPSPPAPRARPTPPAGPAPPHQSLLTPQTGVPRRLEHAGPAATASGVASSAPARRPGAPSDPPRGPARPASRPKPRAGRQAGARGRWLHARGHRAAQGRGQREEGQKGWARRPPQKGRQPPGPAAARCEQHTTRRKGAFARRGCQAAARKLCSRQARGPPGGGACPHRCHAARAIHRAARALGAAHVGKSGPQRR